MDDLAGKITELLNDPGTLEQIMNLTSMLGGTGEEPNPLPPTPAPQQTEPPPEPAVNNSNEEAMDFSSLLSGDTLQTVMRIAPLLGNLKKDDDTSRLLFALRPFLSEERKKKLDNASKLLQIVKILPAIKELNIF